MSNLRLLNETIPTSVTSFQINNVFTDDFNIYKIVISDVDSSSSDTWSHMRFVNSSGTLIISSEYSYSNYQYRSYASFGTNNGVNPNEMRYVFLDSDTNSSAGAVIWVFNPTDTSSHTYMLSESNGFTGTSGTDGTKMIGNLWNTSKITGFGFRRLSGTYDNLTVRTYGLRVD